MPVPCDGASLAGLFFFLDVHNPKTPLLEGIAAIDWLGVLTIVGATVMFLLGLQLGDVTHPWNSVRGMLPRFAGSPWQRISATECTAKTPQLC